MFGETAPRQDHEKLRRTSPPYSGSQKTGNSSYFLPSFHDEFLRHVLVYEIITTFFLQKNEDLCHLHWLIKNSNFIWDCLKNKSNLIYPVWSFPDILWCFIAIWAILQFVWNVSRLFTRAHPSISRGVGALLPRPLGSRVRKRLRFQTTLKCIRREWRVLKSLKSQLRWTT